MGRIALDVASHRFAGGPLLFPGSPFTFAGSCSCTERFCDAEPTVPCCEGPFLPPGAPLIPAPEFWALGAVETVPDVSARFASPGIREAEPGLSCSPTYPDAPEFCVLMPLSASFWRLCDGVVCWAMAGPVTLEIATSAANANSRMMKVPP